MLSGSRIKDNFATSLSLCCQSFSKCVLELLLFVFMTGCKQIYIHSKIILMLNLYLDETLVSYQYCSEQENI